MKKSILVAVIAAFCISNCWSKSISLSVLTNGEWEMCSPDMSSYRKTTFLFTNTKMKEIVYFTKRNKTIANEHYFYLSSNKEDTFDNSKVGKRQMGEYIIEEYIDKTTFWYLPIYVSDTEIHLMTKDDAVIKLKRKR